MYIAHYRKSDNIYQTIREHSINVSEYCKSFGKKLGATNISKLVGLIHDMGKMSDEFQEYITIAIEHEKKGTLKEWEKTYKKVDHGRVGGLYIYSTYHDMNGYAKITAEIISMIVCYHHGGLRDYITFDCKIPLVERFKRQGADVSYQQATTRFFKEIKDKDYIEKLFFQACKEIEVLDKRITESKLDRSFSMHLLIKQLYSILIDADRYDTYLFMDNEQEPPCIDNKELWKKYSQILYNKLSEFKNKKTNSELEERIKQLRFEVSEACADFSDKPTGIYTLTVPTGGGKTLSSLRFALNHASNKEKKRIIYILPFTTIIEQNAKDVRDILQCDEYLLEHHSNVIHFEDAVKDEDDYDNYKLLTQRWDSPIIFTTMVQFLDTIYAGGTRALRRMHNLSDTILIFDEIQAIPIRCISLFNSAINYLSKICNSTVILCSATQPNLTNTKIPLLIENDGEIIPDLLEKFKGFKRMIVEDRRIAGGYSYEKLGSFISDLKENLSSILIVLNTKSCAEKVYHEMRNRNNAQYIFYLSTNLCPSHRKKIIRVMKKCLDRKKSLICVSTQLIEAGVNISFDGVVRHVAGLDSIAQATGRGNRHGEGEVKKSYIINLADESLGNLKEIELGEKHCIEILDEYAKNPGRFDNDLLSPIAIRSYYNYYYADNNIEKLMNYPVQVKGNGINRNTEIYKMLDGRVPNKQSYKDKHSKCEMCFNFMFETAGRYFQVIDQLTTSVLVPYGEGKKIIAELFSSKSFSEKLKALKLVQQYSVNIFEGQKNKLKQEEAFELSEIPGIYVLKDGYYDKSLGVITEKKMDFLNI